MPRINQVNTGRSVISGGSVGRQHVGAPREAFGGTGAGLQKLGAGVATAGNAIQLHQERKDQQAGVEADLSITEEMDRWYQTNSLRRGPNARTLVSDFDEQNNKIIEDGIKGLTPEQQQRVKNSASFRAAGLRRRLFGLEATELKRTEQLNSSGKVGNTIKGASTGIGLLQHSGFDYDNHVLEYREQLHKDITAEADKHELEGAKRDELFEKRRNQFHTESLSALLSNIENDPNSTLTQLQSNVNSYKEIIDGAAHNLSVEQKRILKRDADRLVGARKTKIQAIQTQQDKMIRDGQRLESEKYADSIDINTGQTSWTPEQVQKSSLSPTKRESILKDMAARNKVKKQKDLSSEDLNKAEQSADSISKDISSYDATNDDGSDLIKLYSQIDRLPSSMTGTKSMLKERLKAKRTEPFENKESFQQAIKQLESTYKLDKEELNVTITGDSIFSPGLQLSDEKNLDKRNGLFGADAAALRTYAKSDHTPSEFAAEAKRVIDEARKRVKSDETVNEAFANLIKKPVAVAPTAATIEAADLTGKPVVERRKFKGQPPGTRPIRLKDGSKAWYNTETGDVTPIKESK